MPGKEKVLILGAGIAGQTLGPALVQRGIECEIVELKPAFEIVGAGMYVQCNGLRALHDIGVVSDIVESGWHRDDDCSLMCDSSGNVMAKVKQPRIAGDSIPATVPILRQVLHEILQEKVSRLDIPVRMGTTIESVTDNPTSEVVEVSFSDGTQGEYALVVGADGINSSVRAHVFPGVEPMYSGYSNWRVVLPQPEQVQHITWMFGNGTSIGIIPVGDGKLYLAGVTQEPNDDYIAPDQLLIRFQETFQSYGGVLPKLLSQVTSPQQIVYTPISEIYMRPPWYKGRVVLVGDAAHASTPFWAQGASMAIEDVILLATILDRYADYNAGLSEWMSRRAKRCHFVQTGSKQTGDAAHKSPFVAGFNAQRIQESVYERYARFAEPI